MIRHTLLLTLTWTTFVTTSHAQVTWLNQANDQEFSCIHPQFGTLTYNWPDNDLWSQEQLIADDPCGNSVIREPSNWSTVDAPGGSDSVLIGSPAPAILDIDATIGSLTVSSGGVLQMSGQSSLDIASGGGLTNNGMVTVSTKELLTGWNTGAETGLTFHTSSTIDGTGTMLMDRARGSITSSLNTVGGATLTNASGHLIQGRGEINAQLINNGVIESVEESSVNNRLVLSQNNKTNNNIMRATTDSFLVVEDITLTNTSGQLIAAGGTVELDDGANVLGGTLSTTGDGLFRTGPGGVNITTLTNVTLEGDLSVEASDTLRIAGNGITNNGVITNIATIEFADSGGLMGNGLIELIGGLASAPGAVITQDATHRIVGPGRIDAALVNNGVVETDSDGGLSILELESNDKTNNHIIRANSNSRINLEGFTLTQNDATGRLIANEGEIALLENASIVGGRLESSGAGFFNASSANDTSAKLTDVTLAGELRVRRSLTIAGSGITNNGFITVGGPGTHGANLQAEPSTTFGGSGVVEINGNLLVAQPGGRVVNGPSHTIEGRGTLQGAWENQGMLDGISQASPIIIADHLRGTGSLNNVRIDGTHAPGASTAAVSVDGSYEIRSTGILEIELGGLTPGSEHDQLVATGTVTLDGTLSVSMLDSDNSYAPTAGDRFTIITATTPINDTFEHVNLPTMFMGRRLEWLPVDYTDPLAVVLEVGEYHDSLLGDFNNDRTVNSADYIVWRVNLGAPDSVLPSGSTDDGSGFVDAGDFATWRANFGATLPPASSLDNAAVPEPSTIVSLALLSLAAMYRYRTSAA